MTTNPTDAGLPGRAPTEAEWNGFCRECGHTARVHFTWPEPLHYDRGLGLMTGAVAWRCECGCSANRFYLPDRVEEDQP